MTFRGLDTLPPTINDPCTIPPLDFCYEVTTYIDTINLPPLAGGYQISYQRCCRGPSVTNLNTPEDQGLTLTVKIPPAADAICNSSPRFDNYPPLLLCAGEELVFDHSATDPDGDVIVYELYEPFQGGTSSVPAPSPASPPPYTPVQWLGGFTEITPFGPGPITINSTGHQYEQIVNLLPIFKEQLQ